MTNIFLSYVRSDAKRAKQVADALSDRGWSVWLDTQLTPGVRFRDKIAEELHAASCVVVLWSEASLKSDFVIDEAEDGKRRGVLVQALIEEPDLAGVKAVEVADSGDGLGSGGDHAAALRLVTSQFRAITCFCQLYVSDPRRRTFPACLVVFLLCFVPSGATALE